MAFKINGVTVVNDDREVTVDSLTATANDRFYVGVTATNSPTSVLSPSIFQGSVSGYTAGGYGPSFSNVIDKFPFSSDTNATDVGDLVTGRYSASGQSSTTHGYASGGGDGSSPSTHTSLIDKFSFAVDSNATSVGNLTVRRILLTGQSSETFGYASGGSSAADKVNTIEKFSFATDTNASDVGDLLLIITNPGAQSSTTHGYTSGGAEPPGDTVSNTIQKFPFSSDTNATDVGDLSLSRRASGGQSSTTHGYTSGGSLGPPGNSNTIDKFPFSSDTNATDVGDLTQTRWNSAGQSSTVSGYTSGGFPPNSNVIDKFPFSSDTNATDVGDLTVARRALGGVGQQARTLS